jgi:hypothetical protein
MTIQMSRTPDFDVDSPKVRARLESLLHPHVSSDPSTPGGVVDCNEA